jgi:tetratricopeptide (TPR) repeat protein
MARESGSRAAEAFSRFCLVDVLRTGKDNDRRRAQEHAEAALTLMMRDTFPYNHARALYYVGLAAGERGQLAEAANAWERAAIEAERVGNLVLRPLVLSNLGFVHAMQSNGSRAADYYAESAALYEALGNERGAARQQFNGAALRIGSGDRAAEALKTLQNALRVTQRIGDEDFEIACLELIGEYHRHSGNHTEAARTLNQARSLALQQSLQQRVGAVTLALARLRFDQADYAGSAQLLTPMAQERSGRVATQARLLLGRVRLRLGDLDSARQDLERVRAELDLRDDDGLRPRLYAAMGELAYEAGDFDEALARFRDASEASPQLLDEASVEAVAYMGLIHSMQGRAAAGHAALVESIAAADKMGRVALATKCRVFLARARLSSADPKGAVAALKDVATEKIGVELGMYVHHWRARGLTALGQGGEADIERAQQLLERLRALVPQGAQSNFAARRDIAEVG